LIKEAEQKGRQLADEAKRKAETDVSKIVAQAEEKGRLIIEDAKKKAQDETAASKMLTQAEQKARAIVEAAEKIAAAQPAQRPQHIVRAARESAEIEAKAKAEPPKPTYYQDQVELVIIPPIDYTQLERLRISLQRLPHTRVLSTTGSPYGATQISVFMERPAPLAEALRSINSVEEAIGEELLDSHPLGDFLKKALPEHISKRRDEKRILVVLKRAQQ